MSKHNHNFDDLATFKNQLYQWVENWNAFQICDSNQYSDAHQLGEYELILGCSNNSISSNDFSVINDCMQNKKWMMIAVNYPELNKAAEIHFFEPEVLIVIQKNARTAEFIIKDSYLPSFDDIIIEIQSYNPAPKFDLVNQSVQFQALTNRQTYIENVNTIRRDIQYGKYYELNYCIAFEAQSRFEKLHPLALNLNCINQAPFAVFSKFNQDYLICSSPERFLMKKGNRLISQPIKGTNKKLEPALNELQKENLKNNLKERAENVMIVDLVRNDLAKVSKIGSVKVDELFGVYEFQSVNHLISTISSETLDSIQFSEIMEALFPMGSMTGAPKHEVMMHIDHYESEPRGTYSGCCGYINENGDFDLNVVIRSLFYNSETEQLTYKVGSAITYDSDADQEYEECILKGKKLEDLFKN